MTEIQQITQNNLKKSFLEPLKEKVGTQNLAFIMMAIANIIYPLGFLYGNQNGFSSFQTNLVRAIAILILNISIQRVNSIDMTYQDPFNFKILFMRNLIMTIQMTIFTILQFYISQPIIQTLQSTGPLFVFLLDYQINKVEISRKQFYGVILGIVGVLLTVNGDLVIRWINPAYETQSQFNYSTTSPIIQVFAASLFLLSQVAWAYGQVMTKRLKGVNSIQINIHLGVVLIFTSGMFYPSYVTNPVSIQKYCISLFLGGFVMAISQILFIGAVTMTKNTGALTMLVFQGVVVGYLISIFRYNQKINPICSVGSILILVGLVKIMIKDKIKDQQKNKIQMQNNRNTLQIYSDIEIKK